MRTRRRSGAAKPVARAPKSVACGHQDADKPGPIVLDRLHDFDFSEFGPEVFDVFVAWLTDTYPNDVDVMLDSSSDNFSLTPQALALFEQHTTEFVASRNNSGSD